MLKKNGYSTIVLVVILFFFSAENTRANRLPGIGSRALALGHSFVALSDDGTSIYYNPAGLSLLQRQEINLYYANLYGINLKNSYFSYTLPVNDQSSIGMDWYYLGQNESDFDHSINKIGMALGYRIGKLMIGIKPSYFRTNISWNSKNYARGNGWTLDAGLLFQLSSRVRFGFSGTNFINRINYGDGKSHQYFEPEYTIGVSYYPAPFISVAGCMYADQISLGSEYAWKDLLFFRLGYENRLFSNHSIRVSENNQISSGLTLGSGIQYRFMRIDYSYSHDYDLGMNHHFSLMFYYNPEIITIKEASLKYQPVYKSLYTVYENEESFIYVVIKNSDTQPVKARIKVLIPYLMTDFYEEEKELPPQSIKTFKLGIKFQNQLLTRLDARMDHIVQPVIQIEYIKDKNRKKTEKKLSALYIMGKGKIQWTDTQLAAAFITADNPGIESLARESIKACYPDLQTANMVNPIGRAMVLFDVIGQMGIIYNPDQNTPYEKVGQDSQVFDHIQYPSELLKSKIGDCDDCSVLMSSLLENLGISTCLLDVTDPKQGHIFIMFDVGISLDNASSYFIRPDEYIPYQGRAWMPIEVTQFGKSFQEAYRFGLQEYQRCKTAGYLNIIDIDRAKQIYHSGEVETATWSMLPVKQIQPVLQSDLNWFNQRYSNVCRLSLPMKNSEDFYESGSCFLNFQLLDSASHCFNVAIQMDSTYADAYNALGVIYTRQKDYVRAENAIKRAIELEPENYGFKVNLAIVFYLTGKKSESQNEIKSIPDDSFTIPEELQNLYQK